VKSNPHKRIAGLQNCRIAERIEERGKGRKGMAD
jgi:hypothetical protein